jgi:hypothetical protein
LGKKKYWFYRGGAQAGLVFTALAPGALSYA